MEIITLDNLRDMIKADKDLKDLKQVIETCYTALCALCNEPIEYHTEDEESEDITLSKCRDLVFYESKSKELAQVFDLSDSTAVTALEDNEFDEDFYLDSAPERVQINGVVTDENDPIYTSKQLFKRIKQASHPDKLLRYSAAKKQEILECFHEAQRFYDLNDYSGLVFCYVKVFVIKRETRKINLLMWRYLKQRHEETLLHSRFLLSRDYMPAITAYRKGEIPMAIRLFKQYLKHGKPDHYDDMDCFID